MSKTPEKPGSSSLPGCEHCVESVFADRSLSPKKTALSWVAGLCLMLCIEGASRDVGEERRDDEEDEGAEEPAFVSLTFTSDCVC